MGPSGFIVPSGLYYNYPGGVRPAFNLNLSSILFTCAAIGGKSSGTVGADSLKPVGSNASGEWKLTILDSEGHGGFQAQRADSGDILAGGNIKINYNGAQSGENEYVSVILKDST